MRCIWRRRGTARASYRRPHASERGPGRGRSRRLLEPIGNIPPAEAEAKHYAELEDHAVAA